MRREFAYIVLGCGGAGSGALYWLARRAGGDVLGLEQFSLFHNRGGSQDHSRIIRLTYHDARYTALAPHAYAAWTELEAESGVQVVTPTGGVELAEVGSPYQAEVDAHAAAMDAASISYERIDGAELMRRYPQFSFDTDLDVLVQPRTGIADPCRGNGAHIAMARYHGAAIMDNCPVTRIEPFDGGVTVRTPAGAFTGRRLIVTAGAWVDNVLASVGVSLRVTVTQEQVTYYATPNLKAFGIGRFPIFIVHAADVLYGFPIYGEVATKAAIDASGDIVTADTRTFEPDSARETQLEAWLARHIPGFCGPKLYTKTCLYTMPRDRDFVLDRVPGHPQILVFCGAGHAYKFASLIGRVLSELAIDDATAYPIASFTIDRPAIIDPATQAKFRL